MESLILPKEISLDLQNRGFTTLIYPQGDTDSRKVIISLHNNSKPFYIPESGVKVSLLGTRADNAAVNRYVDSYSGNKVTILFRNEELAVKGKSKYKISIRSTSDDTLLSSFPFIVKVAEDVYDPDTLLANPRIDVLEELIKRNEELTRELEGSVDVFVRKTFHIAGLDMQDNISKEELIQALNLELETTEMNFDDF